ncbi:MAG: flagellar protein FlgN [Bacillota bacterium]
MVIKELQEILESQFLLAESILHATRELTVSLVEDNLSKIMRRNEELEDLAEEMQSLEEKRIAGLARAIKSLGLEQEPTLRELAEEVALPDDLRQAASKLRKKFQELQEQNRLNELLLKQSVYYNQKMQMAINQGSNYQPDGKLEQKKGSSLLDRSV